MIEKLNNSLRMHSYTGPYQILHHSFKLHTYRTCTYSHCYFLTVDTANAVVAVSILFLLFRFESCHRHRTSCIAWSESLPLWCSSFSYLLHFLRSYQKMKLHMPIQNPFRKPMECRQMLESAVVSTKTDWVSNLSAFN
jgi:hypothetical protein